MEGYKAYKKGLVCDPTGCNPFQYNIGETYHCEKAVPCVTGFHFCKEPLDILYHYPLIDEYGECSEFTRVSAENATTKDGYKYCCTDITIGEKLTFFQLVQEQLEYNKFRELNFEEAIENGFDPYTDNYNIEICSDGQSLVSLGTNAFLVSTSKTGHIISSGCRANIYLEQANRLMSSGRSAHILSIQNYGCIESSGNDARIYISGAGVDVRSTGNVAVIRTVGKNTLIKSNGDFSTIYANGDSTAIFCQGNCSDIISMGKDNEIYCTARKAKIKAKAGNFINYCGKEFVVKEEHMFEKGLYYLLKNGKIYLTTFSNTEHIEVM